LTILEAAAKHYRRRLGPPSREAGFKLSGHEIQVFKWAVDHPRNPAGVTIYATLGASTVLALATKPQHRMEFFTGQLPENDDIARPLALLGLHSVMYGTPLDDGHTVSYPEPLWAGTQIHGFLIIRPQSEILPALALPREIHVEFLQAIPVYDSEIAFKKENGVTALLARWEKAGARISNPDRTPNPSESAEER